MVAGVDAGAGHEEGPDPGQGAPRGVKQGDDGGKSGVVAGVAGGKGTAFFHGAGAGAGPLGLDAEPVEADVADSFQGLERPGPVEGGFEDGADSGIADEDGDKGEDDQRPLPEFSKDQKQDGGQEDGPFEKAEAGHIHEKMVEKGVRPVQVDLMQDGNIPAMDLEKHGL